MSHKILKSKCDESWLKFGLICLTAIGLTLGCKKETEIQSDLNSVLTTGLRYLYFASGSCYVGNLTASKAASAFASGIVNRVDLISGQVQGVPVLDYNLYGVNAWPVGVVNYDNDYLLSVITTSTAGMRVDKIKKSDLQNKTEYFTDIVNLTGLTRGASLGADGGLLISKSTAIEKYNASKLRVLNSTLTTSYVNLSTPTSACTTSTTLISATLALPNGMVFFAHAAPGTANRVGVVGSSGYAVAGDCKSAITFSTTPSTNATPTAAVLVPNTDPYQIIVSTASSTAGNDQLWLFTVNSTTGIVTYVKSLYNDPSYVRGPSAMGYDNLTNMLYVANGSTSSANTVEQFSYDPVAQVLTRVKTFLGTTYDTQCVNSMFIAN